MNINPEDIDVENLLGNKFFTIPQFQRPYSWGKEQLSDFWEDFIEKVATSKRNISLVLWWFML